MKKFQVKKNTKFVSTTEGVSLSCAYSNTQLFFFLLKNSDPSRPSSRSSVESGMRSWVIESIVITFFYLFLHRCVDSSRAAVVLLLVVALLLLAGILVLASLIDFQSRPLFVSLYVSFVMRFSSADVYCMALAPTILTSLCLSVSGFVEEAIFCLMIIFFI